MIERIKYLIVQQNLTQTEFANIIGIQRSTLSHILSGRNKPSLDFTLKLLSKFTNINAEWLLNGEGSMYKSTSEDVKRHEVTQDVINDNKLNTNYLLFNDLPNMTNENTKGNENNTDIIKPVNNRKQSKSHTEQQTQAKKEIENVKIASSAVLNCKQIKSIIILFDDGTYDTFVK